MERRQIVRKASHITDAEGVSSGSADGRKQDESGRDPGQTGQAGLGKRCRQQQPGHCGQGEAAAEASLDHHPIQRLQIAPTTPKNASPGGNRLYLSTTAWRSKGARLHSDLVYLIWFINLIEYVPLNIIRFVMKSRGKPWVWDQIPREAAVRLDWRFCRDLLIPEEK